MILVRGINHKTQHCGCGVDAAGADRIAALVGSICTRHAIELIAEESSAEACALWRVPNSICAVWAQEHDMQHLYCDPTSEERAHLGIPTQMELVNQVKAELGVSIIMGAENEAHYNRAAAQYSPVREQFWLGRLAEHRNKRILFICGSDHVETFNALLHKNGWQVQST